MKMDINKQNGNVAFNEEFHKYWNVENEKANYISVTTLIGKYEQPFDKDFWSAYKALEKLIPKEDWKVVSKPMRESKKINKDLFEQYDITTLDFNKEQQAILDMWQEENRKSCERGTAIHAELENSFYKSGKNIELSKFGIGGKFECRKNYTNLDLPYGVYPEYLISSSSEDGILNIAGQVDLLVKNGNEISIIDHKTNKKLEMKSYFDSAKKTSQKMQYPLNHLDDCNFNHYQLQLSIYAWMMQKINPNFIIKDLIINYYDHEGNNKLIPCNYLKNEVIALLKHYKKSLIHEIQVNKRKPIVY